MSRKPRKKEFPGLNVNYVIEAEEPQQCDYCGAIAELRPYGKNGAAICFDCGRKKPQETRANFLRLSM